MTLIRCARICTTNFIRSVVHLPVMAAAASSSSSTSGSGVLPRVLVFDLDGCLWDPEMYELWGSGGSPFKVLKNGNLRDRSGTEVRLLGDVRSILHELKTDPKWKDTVMAVASTCDEPSWARECMQKFPIGDGHVVGDVFSHVEIYKASKARHLKEISKKTGVPLNEMIFYDNQMNNCHAVAGVGVTVMYTPDGVTRSLFEESLKKYPAPGEILGPTSKRGRWDYY